MKDITLLIPGEVVAHARIPRTRIDAELRKELALQLYREGIVSGGAACQLAELSKLEFQQLLGERRDLPTIRSRRLFPRRRKSRRMEESHLVVSNTTPLINFAEVERLDLLEDLFESVIIPTQVETELREKGATFARAAGVPDASFIEVKDCSEEDWRIFGSDLHPGEAACLALAQDIDSPLLLFDELAAREQAAHLGHLFIGTLGCLRFAKDKGLISEAYPILAEMREKARFWLSDILIETFLEDINENPSAE